MQSVIYCNTREFPTNCKLYRTTLIRAFNTCLSLFCSLARPESFSVKKDECLLSIVHSRAYCIVFVFDKVFCILTKPSLWRAVCFKIIC